tara:strand:- start:6070 stop:7968 length:1899 start_codon:yes stop_codon:yes gene_type:complete
MKVSMYLKRLLLSVFLLFVSSLAVVGCTGTSLGISPDPSKLHYPVGLAVHPSGKFLYVANSNFDLAFTGGTLMVLDTTEDPTNTSVVDINGVQTELMTLKLLEKSTVQVGTFAGQLAINATGTELFLAVRQDKVLGSFDECTSDADCTKTYKDAGESCVRGHCRLAQTIQASSVVQLTLDTTKEEGHLQCDNKTLSTNDTGGVAIEGGDEFPPAPLCGDSSKIYLEDSPAPYGVKIIQQCVALRTCTSDDECACSADDKSKGLCVADQRCDFARCVAGCVADTDCKTGEVCEKGRCLTSDPKGSACSVDTDCAGGERCDKGKCTPGCQNDSDCKSGESCTDGRCKTSQSETETYCGHATDCESWQRCEQKRVLVTHLVSGGISELEIPAEGWSSKTVEEKEKLRLVKGNTALPKSATSLTLLPSGGLEGLGGQIFLSSREDANIYMLPPSASILDSSSLVKFPFTHLSHSSSSLPDVRGIVIGHDKKNKWVRLYVAVRNPDIVLVYNLEKNAAGDGVSATLLKTIPVGADPAQIVYRPGLLGRTDLLYVVCSKDRRIDVINTETFQVVHRIAVGQQPYFMTYYEPRSATDEVRHRRAYVANFLDTSITIIDLDKHRVIGRVEGIRTSIRLAP